MSPIYLIAEIQASATKVEPMTDLLKNLVIASRQEAGCVTYELFLDSVTTGLFIMREIWASDEALETHKESSHFQNFVATAERDGLLEALRVKQLTPVA